MFVILCTIMYVKVVFSSSRPYILYTILGITQTKTIRLYIRVRGTRQCCIYCSASVLICTTIQLAPSSYSLINYSITTYIEIQRIGLYMFGLLNLPHNLWSKVKYRHFFPSFRAYIVVLKKKYHVNIHLFDHKLCRIFRQYITLQTRYRARTTVYYIYTVASLPFIVHISIISLPGSLNYKFKLKLCCVHGCTVHGGLYGR